LSDKLVVFVTPRCRNDSFKSGSGSTTRGGKNDTESAKLDESPESRSGLFLFLLTSRSSEEQNDGENRLSEAVPTEGAGNANP
jgi:hypothetical protein